MILRGGEVVKRNFTSAFYGTLRSEFNNTKTNALPKAVGGRFSLSKSHNFGIGSLTRLVQLSPAGQVSRGLKALWSRSAEREISLP